MTTEEMNKASSALADNIARGIAMMLWDKHGVSIKLEAERDLGSLVMMNAPQIVALVGRVAGDETAARENNRIRAELDAVDAALWLDGGKPDYHNPSRATRLRAIMKLAGLKTPEDFVAIGAAAIRDMDRETPRRLTAEDQARAVVFALANTKGSREAR